ncbi:uncharacterized protein LOC126278430 [Schistocerca gregaria]|uniref:uncharacterized protein LOC126278430 n=1 Tax=Schistocerca gregaria TaxID=7010 RepID=UPI00211F1F5F|nr:uncharacterized protein LOC126278430 [Schistocerca gregaria]
MEDNRTPPVTESSESPVEGVQIIVHPAGAAEVKRKDTNTLAMLGTDSLDRVSKASDGLSSFSMGVLAKFGVDEAYRREMLENRYMGSTESSDLPERLQAIEEYFNAAYGSFALPLGVSGSQEQGAEEASREGAVSIEGLTEKKRKKLDRSFIVHQKFWEGTPGSSGSEGRSGTPEGDVLKSSVGTLSSTTLGTVVQVEEPTAGSSPKPVPAGEAQSAPESAGKAMVRQGDAEQSSIGTLSSTTGGPAEQGDGGRKSGKAVVRERGALYHMSATADAAIKIACDYLLTSAKCVACVVGHALKAHGLSLYLLKLSEAALSGEKLAIFRHSMSLTARFTGFAVEAVEAALQYHKSALGYLPETQGSLPAFQVRGALREEVLWQVISAAEEIQKLTLQEHGVRAEELAEKRHVAEAMARILSSALERVNDANAFTKEVVCKFDKSLHDKAMAVTVKGAADYTLFVIFETKKMLGILSEVTAGTGSGRSTEEEASGGSVSQDVPVKDSAPASDVPEGDGDRGAVA